MTCIVASRFSRVSVAFCTATFGPRHTSRGLTTASQFTRAPSRNERNKFLGRSCLSHNYGRRTHFDAYTRRTFQTPIHTFSTSGTASKQPIRAFEKVPTTLPDWWDDEEDDDTAKQSHTLTFEKSNAQVAFGSGNGSLMNNGANGGSGRGEHGKFNSDGDGPKEGLFAVLMAMYMRAMSRNPILTKAITTSIVAFLGDVLAQSLTQIGTSEFQWDTRRTLSIALWGFCFIGPTLHYWFSTLDRTFTHKYSVISKLIVDQLFFAPFFNSAFMMGVGTLEGHSFKEVCDTVKTKLWSAMKANWMLWPAAQFINFSFVPRNFQVVYVNCVALAWNMIFMYISHSKNEAAA